jgi:hypothetical protein
MNFWLGGEIPSLGPRYKRLPETLAGLHLLAFAILRLKRVVEILAHSS